MNMYSHFHVGAIILRQLRKEYGIHLPSTVFCYGNMRPDFSLKYKRIPHYKADMYENIRQDITKLVTCDKSKWNAIVLADRLGVICHFLCDFFCYAHSEKFTGTLREHFKYESDLNRYIKERRFVCDDVNFLADVDLDGKLNSLLESLDKRYVDYIQLETSPGFDMVCAIQACMEVTVRILQIIICKSQLSSRVNRQLHVPISPAFN